ncbi:anthrone oxygenase family protein [Amycolatopsis halotolerans]|uniref:Anthrone oxygenase family protein n=1 Tax=Amycolatopsis halotolerans TaxID=330083 RepID=A0ABV7QW80_9PSEU
MYQVLIFAAILAAAMLVGLMATLLSVMRAMWRGQADDDAARNLQDFLRHAATNRILSTLTIIPIACSIALGFLGAPTAAKYACAMTAGGVFLTGFFLWTAVFNLPIYTTVSRWDLATTPADVRSVISRFHRVNAVRLCAALIASGLFFLAA